MDYSLVLSDSLYSEFYAFKHGRPHDAELVEKMLHLYKPPLLTNVSQLKRLGIDDAPLMTGLASAGFVNQDLDELSRLTFYKLILSHDCCDFPYVDVHGDLIRSNYTLTCEPGEKRTKIYAWLKALLAKASWVVLHDPYSVDNWSSTKQFFETFFPYTPLSIHCTFPIPQDKVRELKSICSEWKLPGNAHVVREFRKKHDRYLIIDNRVQVIMTSGIDYLFDEDKECTIIVRKR
jgi:hypothetical protein